MITESMPGSPFAKTSFDRVVVQGVTQDRLISEQELNYGLGVEVAALSF